MGSRPTLGGVRDRLEVHLLNYAGDLYGQRLTVRFEKKVREEKKFSNIADLREAIHQDIATVKQWFGIA